VSAPLSVALLRSLRQPPDALGDVGGAALVSCRAPIFFFW
jgi:hypothetical protein